VSFGWGWGNDSYAKPDSTDDLIVSGDLARVGRRGGLERD
jgi:hypothetical protein